MKPGDLVRVVRGPSSHRTDQKEPWSWLWKEIKSKQPEVFGKLTGNDVGLVLQVLIRQRWAKVQVGDKIGWIDCDHVEVISESR